MASTFTWNGGSASASDPTQWTPNGIPNPGDTIIVEAGSPLFPLDSQLSSNTVEVASATLNFTGDNSLTVSRPTLDQNSLITTSVPGVVTPETTVLNSAGIFVNQGTIEANGPAGSSFTLNVTANGTAPGYFLNYTQISVDAGNKMTIAVGANSELFNAGEILVNGGSLLINANTAAIAGGYAPTGGALVLAGGGTVETNAAYAGTISGTTPLYVFADSTTGNTLKIDNIGANGQTVSGFGGQIIGFAAGDTIDIANVASLAITKAVYSQSTGVLNLENASGTIEASLLLSSGNFTSSSFNIGTAGSDIVLTTTVTNDTYSNNSGSWQTGANWSNGVPGVLDTAFIGFGAASAFTLTTGSAAVSVGALSLASSLATLQITSNTTASAYPINAFAGTLEVTSGNTLTTSALRQTGGMVQIDPTAVLNLTGRQSVGAAANNGTIAINTSNTIAVRQYAGTIQVNGGTINAAPSVSGGGGNIRIGYDGGGTPGAVTVQNSGANAGVVTDSYAIISSDPISYGVLTLNGNVTWTDAIDSHDSSTSTGKMIVGNNDQAANTSGTQPAIAGTATLLAENGANLIDQNFAVIASSSNSSGEAIIETGAIWTIGGTVSGSSGSFNVGQGGNGSVSILNGGTIQLNGTSGVVVGQSAGIAGSITVSGTNPSGGAAALLNLGTSATGFTLGQAGTGVAAVGSGGTLSLNGSKGILLGQSATATGVLSVTGPSAVVSMGTTTGNVTIGQQGIGTLDIESGGAFQMSGTGAITAGQSASSAGTIIVNGSSSVLDLAGTGGNITVGQSGSGTLQVSNGGHVTIAAKGLTIGSASGGSGTVTVSGANSAIVSQGTTAGINVGATGNGVLTINSGGVVTTAGGMTIATGTTSTNSGIVTVNTGGTLSDGSQLSVGSVGSGTLSVQGGAVQLTGTNGISVGFSAGSNGLLIINSGTVSDGNSFSVGSTNAANGTVELQAGLLNLTGSFSPTINTSGTGHAVVLVSGGTWDTPGLIIGSTGSGSVDVQAGLIQSTGTSGINVASNSSGSGTLTVENNGTLSATGLLSVANPVSGSSQGSVTVGDKGTVTVAGLMVGAGGTITVGGTANAAQLSTSSMTIGQSGSAASLVVNQFGTVTQTGSFSVNVGFNVGATGTIDVNGGTLLAGSGIVSAGNTSATGIILVENSGTLSSGNGFAIGNGGTGTLTVKTNGVVANTGTGSFNIGSFSGGTGAVVVNGGTLTSASAIFVGNTNATASLLVQNGGKITTTGSVGFSQINAAGTGSATATISGGSWTSQIGLIVGDNGKGSLLIDTNGNVSATSVTLGNQTGGVGSLTINSGTLNASGGVFIGSAGTGSATIDASSTLLAGGLTVGGTLTLAGGIVSMPTNTANINGLMSGFGTVSASVNDSGSIVATGGTLDITGNVSGNGGFAIANGAVLEIDGTAPISASVAFNTGTETLILGTPGSGFSSAITGFNTGDQIEFNFGNSVSITSAAFTNGNTIHITESNSSTYDLTNVSLGGGQPFLTFGKDNGTGDQFIQLLCFARGTQIATPDGEVPVEQLVVGDRVLTWDGRTERVEWIGTSRVMVTPGRRSAATPVIVRQGALADNVPHRDLRVTKGHSLLIDDALIPVEFLVNHRSIVWDDKTREIEIYHVELPQHGVLIADGAPAESYRDDGNRWLFHNANPAWDLPQRPPCAPVLTGGALLDAAWQWLLDRAGGQSHLPLTDDPDLHLVVDGVRVDGSVHEGGVHKFRLMHRPSSVRIVSRSGSPQELGIARDPRALGVALRQIRLRQNRRATVLRADHPLLTDGFHQFEPDNGFRWTDGNAALPDTVVAKLSARCVLELQVGCTARYPLPSEKQQMAA